MKNTIAHTQNHWNTKMLNIVMYQIQKSCVCLSKLLNYTEGKRSEVFDRWRNYRKLNSMPIFDLLTWKKKRSWVSYQLLPSPPVSMAMSIYIIFQVSDEPLALLVPKIEPNLLPTEYKHESSANTKVKIYSGPKRKKTKYSIKEMLEKASKYSSKALSTDEQKEKHQGPSKEKFYKL